MSLATGKSFDLSSFLLRPSLNDRKSRRKKQAFEIFSDDDDNEQICTTALYSLRSGPDVRKDLPADQQLKQRSIAQYSSRAINSDTNIKQKRMLVARSSAFSDESVNSRPVTSMVKAPLSELNRYLQAPAFFVDRVGSGGGKENLAPDCLLLECKVDAAVLSSKTDSDKIPVPRPYKKSCTVSPRKSCLTETRKGQGFCTQTRSIQDGAETRRNALDEKEPKGTKVLVKRIVTVQNRAQAQPRINRIEARADFSIVRTAAASEKAYYVFSTLRTVRSICFEERLHRLVSTAQTASPCSFTAQLLSTERVRASKSFITSWTHGAARLSLPCKNNTTVNGPLQSLRRKDDHRQGRSYRNQPPGHYISCG